MASNSSQEYDYIVVGSGASGAVVGHRLSEAGHSVLMLEAGPADRSYATRFPAAMLRLGERYDWRYPATPDASRGGKQETWRAGRVAGGSTAINGMVWVRGNPADFDGWKATGCEGWGYEDVLPYFIRSESLQGQGDDRFRGRTGPIQVSRFPVKHELIDAFTNGAERVGFKRNPDYNGESQEGVSETQLNVGRGLRSSTSRTYLARARRQPNFRLETNAVAQRVIVERGRATGVEYVRGPVTHRVTARREVILSAGAIGSPKLLLLSGIGPAEHLAEVGVPLTVDSPLVGENLTDHSGVSLTWEVNVRTLNRYLTPALMARAAYDWAVHRTGVIAAGPSAVQLFGSYKNALRCDYQVHMVPLSTQRATFDATKSAGLGSDMKLSSSNAMSAILKPLHPTPAGRIRLRSADPAAPPLIEHELLNDEELDSLHYQGELVRRIAATPDVAPYIVRELDPGPEVVTREQWYEYIRTKSYRGVHPVSTCAMGPSEDSVVDPQLRVRGVEGLRVIDASIMPTITSGNTNAPSVMVGERGAALVLESVSAS